MTKLNSKLSTLLKLSTACFLLSLAIVLPVHAEEIATSSEQNIPVEEKIADEQLATTTPENIPEVEDQNQFTIALTIRYKDQILFDNLAQIPNTTEFNFTNVNPDGSVGEVNTTSTLTKTVLSALLAADKQNDNFNIATEDILYYSTYNPPSFYLKCINVAEEKLCNNWKYTVDNIYSDKGMDQYDLYNQPNAHIYIYFGDRYQINTDQENYKIGTQAVATLLEYDFKNDKFNTATDQNLVLALVKTVGWSDEVQSSGHIDPSGQVSLSVPAVAGNFNIALEQNWEFGKYYINYHPITAEYPTKLTIRYKDSILLDQSFPLPTSTLFNYHNSRENEQITTSTEQATALTLLLNADKQNDNFQITDIEYYSWGSFLVKNIHLNYKGEEVESGNNWQYTVNGSYRDHGMDQEILNDETTQHIYLYFGDRHQIITDKTAYTIGEQATATLNEYDYKTDMYKAVEGSQILGLLDSSDNVLATSTINISGQSIFLLSSTGTYKIGLENASAWGNYYWPTTNLTVTEETTPPPNNSGGGSPSPTYHILDTPNAIKYLNSRQNPDGSFDNILNTDWAAIAYGAYNQDIPEKEKIKTYLQTNTNIAGGLNQVSDLSRRAMALMALGINPYSGTGVNYIQQIIDSYNNGQFGDKDLYNDDIFALFPLLKAGYLSTDEKISSATQFIISKQSPNGSWDGVDLTAATIQSLKQVSGTTEAINKAKTYLLGAQQADGGFGNTFSTAWAIQAGASLGESDYEWVKKANNYLYTKQNIVNGSVEENVWATAEAIPAGLNKSWPQILNAFSKPIDPIHPLIRGEYSYTTTTYPIATTTLEIATTTLAVATTTEPLVLGEKITEDETMISEPTTPAPHIAKPITNNVPPKADQPRAETIQTNNTKDTKVEKTNELINNLPLDTPTRKAAKKVAAVTGGSAVAVGLYLGFRLLKNVI